MAATVQLRRLTAAGPTLTDVTGVNDYLETSEDVVASSPAYPLPIGAAGYSYWAVFQLYAVTSPATSIDTIRVYLDGADPSPSGVTFLGQTATSYIQATGTPGTTGIELKVANYATLSGAPVDPFTWTSGSPKSVSGSIANPATGAFGDFIVIQCKTNGSQTDGTELALPDLVVLYNET